MQTITKLIEKRDAQILFKNPSDTFQLKCAITNDEKCKKIAICNLKINLGGGGVNTKFLTFYKTT